jgi:leader peptidase (prepilin peptidase)/N-methyltransferase
MIELFEVSGTYRIFVYVIVAIFGLIVGSFLNVVALRLLKEESFVHPASHCPKCKHPIHFYDNIPIISYILLMGKCRNCEAKISIQYPLVEFSTAFLFLFTFYCFGFSFQTAGMMLVESALIVLTVTDLYKHYIFDITSVWLIPFGLVYNLFNLGHVDRPPLKFPIMPESISVHIPGLIENGSLLIPGIFVSAIIAIVVAVVFFEGLSKLGEIFLGKYGFGMGDTKLCAGLGAWFGWELLVVIIFLSFVAQAVVALPVLFYTTWKEKDMKALYALGSTMIAAVLPFTFTILPLSDLLVVVFTLICFAVVGVGLIIFLKRSKERDSLNYMPLGPAIVFGALVVIFYGDQIIQWYTQFYPV